MAFNDNMMMPAKVEHPYAAETMMNYLYDPEVAAKLAAYVNYISPVKGAKEVLEKTDPEIANNQLIFPPPEIAGEAPGLPDALARGRADDAGGDGEGDGRLSDAAALAAARGASCSPWIFLAPGLLWLIVFFAIPLVNQLNVSLHDRRPGDGLRVRLGVRAPTRTRSATTTSSSCARSATPPRRRSCCFVIAFPLAYFIAFKAGRWKNLMLLLIILPFFVSYVLRTVSWQLILVRRRLRRRHAADDRPGRRRRAAAGHAHGRDRGHHLQLPAVHGAAAVRVAREDRPAADRGGDRPLREPRDGVPQDHAAAGAAGHLRRLAADVHPGRAATSSTPRCSGRRAST